MTALLKCGYFLMIFNKFVDTISQQLSIELWNINYEKISFFTISIFKCASFC